MKFALRSREIPNQSLFDSEIVQAQGDFGMIGRQQFATDLQGVLGVRFLGPAWITPFQIDPANPVPRSSHFRRLGTDQGLVGQQHLTHDRLGLFDAILWGEKASCLLLLPERALQFGTIQDAAIPAIFSSKARASRALTVLQ